MARCRLTWISCLLALTAVQASAEEPAAGDIPIGGPFANDLRAEDDFGTVVEKLLKIPGVNKVVTPFKDFTEPTSRDAAFAAIQAKVAETPALVESVMGLDKPVLSRQAFALTSFEFESTPISLRVTFGSSAGLILKSPDKALPGNGANFYAPLFIERIDVRLQSNSKDALSLAVKSFPQVSAALEQTFAPLAPAYGTIARTKSDNGELLRMTIHHKEQGFKLFCVNGFASEADKAKEKEKKADGFLVFEAKRDPALQDSLDAYYQERLRAVQADRR